MPTFSTLTASASKTLEGVTGLPQSSSGEVSHSSSVLETGAPTEGIVSGLTDLTDSTPNHPVGSLGVSSGTWGDVSSSFGDTGAVGDEVPSTTNL